MGQSRNALWVTIFLLVLTIWAAPARSDGKFFVASADESGAGSTIPAQRAIIAWEPPFQTLAIDTAFVGDGNHFAWLVPLPSEPDITPVTRGMFDSVAALTAPRLSQTRENPASQTRAVTIMLLALFGMAARGRARDIVLVVALCVLLPVFMLPAIGKAKSSPSVAGAVVDVLGRSSAGVYDTVTLRADRAEDLLAWLADEGFFAGEGVRPVVQDYLDRGWVFAAAKVRSDATGGQHQAHPLCFRFRADAPVYPMALTAVDNTDIRLDLFVFADGSARTDRLERRCSLPTVLETGMTPDRARAGVRDDSDRVRVVHEGLSTVTSGLPNLTRLSGTLAPHAQRADIVIEVTPFRRYDPEFAMPGRGFDRGVSVVLWTGAVLLPVILLARVLGRIPRDRAWRLAGWVLPVALLAGVAGASMVRVYDGPIRSGHRPSWLLSSLETMGHMTFIEADKAGVSDEDGLRAIAAEQRRLLYDSEAVPAFGEGDGPLSTGIKHEPGVGWWFIWRDLAGGEHRVGPYPSAEASGMGPPEAD